MHPQSLVDTLSSALPLYLTAEEAAAYCRLSRSYLDHLRVRGDGARFAKMGKRVVYLRADLDQWLASRLRRSTSDTGKAA